MKPHNKFHFSHVLDSLGNLVASLHSSLSMYFSRGDILEPKYLFVEIGLHLATSSAIPTFHNIISNLSVRWRVA